MNNLYTINYEYITADTKAFALRLCGDLIGYYDSYNQTYSDALMRPVRGVYAKFTIVSLYMDVLWVRKGNVNRVIYGADISEFNNIEQAAIRFANCVDHSIQCNKG